MIGGQCANAPSNRSRGRRGWRLAAVLCSILCTCSACAFNVIGLRATPTNFAPEADNGERLILKETVKVTLVEGFASPLKAETRWRKEGTVPEGDVMTSSDQVVTVEASNMFEARPVIKNGRVVGFYLPIEKSFTPADPPSQIALSTTE